MCQLLPCQATGTANSLRYLHSCAQCFGASSWRRDFRGVHSNLRPWGSLVCFAACRCIYRLKFLRRILGTRHAGALRISLCGLLCWRLCCWGGGLLSIRKGVGRTHKDPPLMFRVLYLARPRTGTRSFMVDAGEMKSHRPRYGACRHVFLDSSRPLFQVLVSG